MSGDLNLYGYVGNSPPNFTDPLGLDKDPPDDDDDDDGPLIPMFGAAPLIPMFGVDYGRAIEKADQIIANAAPDSHLSDKSLYMKGLCYLELNETSRAVEMLTQT